MSGEPSVPAGPQLAQLRQVWMGCLQSVLGQIAGFPISVEAEDAGATVVSGPPALGSASACMVITAAKALQGEMAIQTTEAVALALAQLLVSEQLNAAVAYDQDRREAFEEFLRQVLGQVASQLKSVAGGEVELKPSASEPPAWSDTSRAGIRITSEKFAPLSLTLLVSPQLAKSLQDAPASEPASRPAASVGEPPAPPAIPSPAVPSPGDVPAAVAPPPESASAPPARNSNLEMLLDLHLEATIRFGQKQMLLREILELHPGSAVALDRMVQEPVELVVGGRTVAQGEVVIVDGNYGIRITEILSPQQRIESLGKGR